MKRTIPLLMVGVLVAIVTALAVTLGARDRAMAIPGFVPVGYDLFETEPGETYIDPLPVAANFGGEGCDAFAGHVDFVGLPIDSYGSYTDLSPTDTIVRRLAPAGPFYPVTIPIEIVALSLVSVNPITLTNCTSPATQLWYVSATIPEGDTMQTAGSMTIRHQYYKGGTFDSTLPVNPIFTFTRVSDQAVIGAYRLSDLGPIIPFDTTGANWCRDGNPLDDPAGHVIIEQPGLTTKFVPGVICPDSAGGGGLRKKVLTSHEMLLAKHGVKPAEKKVIYKCFDIPGQDPIATFVSTVTQFGNDFVEVGPGHYFCPSTIKNGTKGSPDLNETPIECYDIAGSDPPHIVNLVDQFASETMVAVGPAELLCVPAPKQAGLALKPYYVCYDTPGIDPPDVVDLETQFGLETSVPVGPAKYLCAPAYKDGNGGPTNVPHLRCYEIVGSDPPDIINIYSQFGPEFGVPVGMAELLCVPVQKKVKSPPPGNPVKLPFPGDSDGDGCPDQRENDPTQTTGGLRDYLNEWDYFNPTSDGINRVDDILATVGQYHKDSPNATYTPATDRTALMGGDPWDLGPPNGQQRVDDILASVKQYHHDCSAGH